MDSLKAAWEWVKKNWMWILFPVGIALFILGRLSRRPEVITSDPVQAADRRAREERQRREQELAAEQARLQARLDAVHAEHAEQLQQLTQEQRAEAATMSQDPDKLAAWLRSL